MRVITFALARAQEDPEKAKDYPKSYSGTHLAEDETHIWMRVGRDAKTKAGKSTRRTIAIPKTSILRIVASR